jgi:GNAT superfamily N-acetyltransferase
MTPEVFAEWLQRQGHRVVRTKSTYWFDQGPRVFQSFPYHWVIQPTEEELIDFLCRENAIGLRYSTPLEAEEGSCSYHVVYERPTYELKHVDSSIRGKVRKGLEACRVGPISLDRYAKEGWSIERDTQSRQHRHTRRGRNRWERMVGAAVDLEGFEVWGAEVDGRLAATLMFAKVDGCIDLLYQQSLREFLPLRVNNALLFETTRALVARPDIQLIHNGLHSLDAPASVDQFKARLGYTLRPVRQRVMFHPRLAPLFGPGTSRFLERLAHLFPEREIIQKAEGLTRFYCNGKLPLARQMFPELLEPDRTIICRNLGDPSMSKPEIPLPDGSKVRISPANAADLASLVDLHLACFSEDEHFALKLGRPFIRDAYRWFVTSPETLVIVARIGERIVGLTALSKRRYNLPMLKACKWSVTVGLLRRPWLAFRPDWLWRLVSPLFSRWIQPPRNLAQIAFTGIAPEVQGHGIGRALKQASIAACRNWGAAAIITGVTRKNSRAKALNESFGFVEVPELSTHRLLYLRLKLDAPAPGHQDEPALEPAPPHAPTPSHR